MNYKAICEFNGQAFYGWQRQKKHHTVQADLEQALTVLFSRHTAVYGCGRTDRGVSARDYTFSFKTENSITNRAKFMKSVNALTDKALNIKSVKCASDDFHARYSCIAREYRYYVYNGVSPLNRPFHYELNRHIDRQIISEEMLSLKGTHDFSSFCRRQSLKKNNHVNLSKAEIRKRGREYIFIFKADRFLHNMIRLMVGTLLDISNGYDMTIMDIIKKKDVKYAGRTAPPEGLVFHKAYY